MSLFNRLNPGAVEESVSGHVRLFISLAIGAMVLVGIVALSVFFIAVRGAEQTLVPEVRNKDLTEALLELQVKELYPRIQIRYSDTSIQRGIILEQDPLPGAIVKAGRRIRLVVSQGLVINTIENFRGRNIEEVRMDLLTLFAASPQPLLSLQEPFMYEFSTEPQGTILQQNPEPGTPVSGPTELEFVVSRGPEHRTLTVPALAGLTVAEAVEQLSKSKVNFVFSQRAPRGTEKGGIVLSQEPAAETQVESNQAVSILVSSPVDMKSGEVFGLFTYTLPENPYPLPVRLEALLPAGGERQLLLELDFIGGAITYPYQLPAGSTLILTMLHREFYREAIQPPLDELSLDQL